MESTIAWMIAGGARLDDREPDPRRLAHLAELRAATRATGNRPSPLTRLVDRFRVEPVRATTTTMTNCCAA